MGDKALVNPTITINNIAFPYLPNTSKMTEGKGEQSVRTQVSGGNIESIYSDDAESKIGKVMFELANTVKNIELARGWKSNEDQNSIIISADPDFTRTFGNMALLNDYEISFSKDGNLSLEFSGNPAV